MTAKRCRSGSWLSSWATSMSLPSISSLGGCGRDFGHRRRRTLSLTNEVDRLAMSNRHQPCLDVGVGRQRGYARRADKNVSDHASSASTGPTTARHTRSTVEP